VHGACAQQITPKGGFGIFDLLPISGMGEAKNMKFGVDGLCHVYY